MMVDRDNSLGIYISIPFCRSKCTYCNFASGVFPAGEHARYVSRVIEDMADAERWSAEMGVRLPRCLDTVYLGGGTPSLLGPELMERLFAAVRAEFEIEAGAEITVECAPAHLSDGTLAAMVRAGVNRVSLGVQSFIDSEAHASGRLHDRKTVEDDLARLRAAGIMNLNVDLIAGLAGQTFASWRESVETLVASDVPHASIYMLEVDEDSRLGREMLAGGARYHAGAVPTDETIARMYSFALERLAEAGLRQYEISNFCRPGYESQHNMRYWQRRPYLGLGLDASSMVRAISDDAEEPAFVLRSTTADDLAAYLAGPGVPETAWLSSASQHEEAWFLGLRLNAGVRIEELEAEFGRAMVAAALQVIPRLVDDGLVTFKGGVVRLTDQGRLLSNDVFQQFLGLGHEQLAGR